MLKTAVFNLIRMMRLSTLIFLATLCFGADPETTNDMFAAIRANDLARLKILAVAGANLRGDRDTTPLMFASAYGSVDAIELLLNAVADVNAQNAFGYTALMWG
jgi:ankyrin repeat protein